MFDDTAFLVMTFEPGLKEVSRTCFSAGGRAESPYISDLKCTQTSLVITELSIPQNKTRFILFVFIKPSTLL